MTNAENIEKQDQSRSRLNKPLPRALLFSLLFFLVMTAYYQVKPSSHSLFVTFLGAKNLPYMWIASAIALAALLPLFFWQGSRAAPIRIVANSSLCFAVLLVIFWRLLENPTSGKVVAFYILVDIYGVVLIEQFWGLAGSLYQSSEGKKWYGVLGSGALLGGAAGSALASSLLAYTSLRTVDLPLVAAAILLLLAVLTMIIAGRYPGALLQPESPESSSKGLPRRQSRPGGKYVLLVVLLVLFAQLVEPVIEFQFMTILEQAKTSLEERTQYLAGLFMLTSIVALAVNLTITPFFHRCSGTIAGLALQPLMLILGSCWFIPSTSLTSGAVLKILDRSLSYSINRASRELLYLPLTPAVIFKVKSWADIFGYRIFKTIASFLILGFAHWLPARAAIPELSWLVILLSLLWLAAIWRIRPRYNNEFLR